MASILSDLYGMTGSTHARGTVVSAAAKSLYGIGEAVSAGAKSLYGMGEAVNGFLDRHIAELKQSDNPTLASTGRVLEAAKFGFGLGYMSSVAIIAAGQLLLGNPLLAAGAVATGVTLSNPMAMTCAAVGAIYYGWGALSDAERASILERLAVGLEMGIELLKSLIDFVVRKVKEGFSSKQLTEFKAFIKTQAAQFGTSLYDVTHAVGDLVRGTVESAGNFAGQVVDLAASAAKKGVDLASDVADTVSDTASGVASTLVEKGREAPKAFSQFVSSQSMDRRDSELIDAYVRLSSKVWCEACRREVSMTSVQGRMDSGSLVLSGRCSECFERVTKVVARQ